MSDGADMGTEREPTADLLAVPALEDERAVGAAEAEGIGQGVLYFVRDGGMRHGS